MKHDKTFIRNDGSKVNIEASVSIRSFGGEKPEWSVRVTTCAKGKRTWFGVYSTDDHSFRKLSQNERIEFVKEAQLKHVTEAEIQEVKMELWLLLKPQP